MHTLTLSVFSKRVSHSTYFYARAKDFMKALAKSDGIKFLEA